MFYVDTTLCFCSIDQQYGRTDVLKDLSAIIPLLLSTTKYTCKL